QGSVIPCCLLAHFPQIIDNLRKVSQQAAWNNAALSLSQTSMVTAASLAVLVLGGLDVAGGRISLGALMSFYVAMLLLGNAVQQTFTSMPHMIEGWQALQELASFAAHCVSPPYTGSEKVHLQGSIELENVCFRYASTQIFENVTVRFPAGSTTCITGAN